MNNTDYFSGIIGQESAKKKLSFYMDVFKKTELLPNLLFEGANGAGKTMLAHRVANLTGREWLEVNGATVRNVKQFFNEVLLDVATKSSLLFIDELHALPSSVCDLLLSAINPTTTNLNRVRFDGIELEINLKEVCFLFATTETQKVFKPLVSRLTSISLGEYDNSQLAQIIKHNANPINVEDSAANMLSSYTRGTGRAAALMGRDIISYATVLEVDSFGVDDVSILVDTLTVFPLGLKEIEVSVLGHIRDSGAVGVSLTGLAAKTNLTRDAQQSSEAYLQKQGLMRIEGKRQITAKGVQYLQSIGR